MDGSQSGIIMKPGRLVFRAHSRTDMRTGLSAARAASRRMPLRVGMCVAAVAVMSALMLSSGSNVAHAHTSESFSSKLESVPFPGVLDVTLDSSTGRLELTVPAGHTVTVAGYVGEPYLRIDVAGPWESNERSPAHWVNKDSSAATPIPPSANPDAQPHWVATGEGRTVGFHDHRAHWMASEPPPAARDAATTVEIGNWEIPVAVDGVAGTITGVLFYTPTTSSFTDELLPVAAVVALAAVPLSIAVLLRRRDARRAGNP